MLGGEPETEPDQDDPRDPIERRPDPAAQQHVRNLRGERLNGHYSNPSGPLKALLEAIFEIRERPSETA